MIQYLLKVKIILSVVAHRWRKWKSFRDFTDQSTREHMQSCIGFRPLIVVEMHSDCSLDFTHYL
jgi:hypothetical protein